MAEKEATFLASFLIFLHLLIDHVLEFILGWYLGPKRQCILSQDKDQESIVSKSAVELAQLVRKRKLKSYDVVKAYLGRMEILKQQINAIMDGPFPEALEEATEIDRKLDNNEYSESELKSKPFLGVPFTTKDSTAVAGKLQTLGLISRKNAKAEEDAECVRLMKESGAIIIATSNVPEVNMWCETRNNLIGQTNNPYDLRRSAGGSSGGEAALISSCCTAFGLGTDIGGSIRIPAFKCGIFGHKPTKFAVDTRGCTFRTGKEEQTMVVAGPMARYSRDLMPIFKILLRPEVKEKMQIEKPVDLKKLRYFYIPCNRVWQCNPINNETQMVMHKVRRHFQNLTGNEVQLLKLPGTEYSHKLWRYWMTQEPAEFSKLLGNGIEVHPFAELLKKLVGKSDFTMAAIYGLINSILPPEKEEKMREITSKLKRTLKEILGDDGVLFYHSSPRTAPFHYYPLAKFVDISYFSIFNVLHTPVTQVPMGLDANGMPTGIQVVSNEMNDRLCIAVAEELERGFGGWIPPYNIKN
uniref:Amidase domain-containing protein n=1 Tax=Glossina brevipalpis TaxID=37001 RepID=A0A1A9X225_9MUSC